MTAHLLAYTLDHLKAEVSYQGQHIAWTDRWKYHGQTRWIAVGSDPMARPDLPDPGLWILRGQSTRAPLVLASARPRQYGPGDRVELWPSAQALELGLSVQWDRSGGLVYLSAPHDVWVPPQTTILHGHLQQSLANRLASAVRLLRQAGLPATAEDLLSAQGRLTDVVADVQRAVSAAADREQPMTSPLLTWAEVGAAVGEVLD